MRMLDRSRDFGQIWGSGEDDGALYTQDGLRFTAQGEEVVQEQVLLVKEADIEKPVAIKKPKATVLVAGDVEPSDLI